MNCAETIEMIGALLDDELDPTVKANVEQHLVHCIECADGRHRMLSLSNLLQVSQVDPPPAELDERIMESFRHHRAVPQSSWRKTFFGSFVIPIPAFAMLLILVAAGFWTAFQIGRVTSTAVQMTSPPAAISDNTPDQTLQQTGVKTVYVEVPVVKQKTVVRTRYIRTLVGDRRPAQDSPETRQDNLPIFNSTTTANSFINNLNLQGFQPPAEMNARIIQEEKKDEK